MLVSKGCPNCGNKTLKGWKAISCTLEVKENKDTGELVFNVVEEDTNQPPQYDVSGCPQCNTRINRNQLVDVVSICKKCGNKVSGDYLNDEGICYTCVAAEDMPDIAKLSKEDLILMLIKSKQGKVSSDIEQKENESETVIKKRKIKRKTEEPKEQEQTEQDVTVTEDTEEEV